MRKILFTLAMSMVTFVATTGQLVAQVSIAITNPSFEAGTGNALEGWTETGGTDSHFQVVADAAATDGLNVANLRGLHTMGQTSGITQVLATNYAPGAYELSFDAASRATGDGTTSIYARMYYGTPSAATTVGETVFTLLDGTNAPALSPFTLEVSLPGGDAIGQAIGIQFMNAGADSVFIPGTVGEGGTGNTLLLDNLSLLFTSSSGLIPGDADGDNGVDFDDFIWLSDRLFTDVEPFTNGDFNGTGQPDFDDFGVWKAEYVAAGGNLALLEAYYAAQVPEPSALVLTLIGLGLVIAMRQKR